MTDERDPDVQDALDRHTPDVAETPDWPRVVRAAGPRRSLRLPSVGRLRWIPGAVGALALVALVAALIVATPDGDDQAASGTSTAGDVTTPAPTSSTAGAPPPGAMRAYLSDAATASQIAHMRATLDALRDQGRIVTAVFRSKEAALEDLRSRLEDPSILDELPSNPLPATFEITLPPDGDAEAVAAALASEPALDPVLGLGPVSGGSGG